MFEALVLDLCDDPAVIDAELAVHAEVHVGALGLVDLGTTADAAPDAGDTVVIDQVVRPAL